MEAEERKKEAIQARIESRKAEQESALKAIRGLTEEATEAAKQAEKPIQGIQGLFNGK